MKTNCPIYSLQEANLNFADKTILKDATVHLHAQDKVCLIGSNGCGKSTLLKLIADIHEADSCTIYKNPGLKTAYLQQDVTFAADINANDFVLSNAQCTQYVASSYLRYLKIPELQNTNAMSGGEKRRVALATTLAQEADLLLLDEPTNHLDIEAIEWLEEYLLKKYQGAVVCVSHDRKFLSNITNRIWWLEKAVLRQFNKGFKYFEQWQDEILTHEEATLIKLNKKLDAETKWLHQGVTARRKRNQGRLEKLNQLRGAVQNRIQTNIKISFDQETLVSNTKFIIEAKDICYDFAGNNLIKDFNFKILKGERVGLIGPNGSGKSTLLRILTKEIKPKEGKIIHGQNLEIAYLDQNKSTVNAGDTLLETLCPNGGHYVMVQERETHAASYLKEFLFDPKLLHAKVSTLSGGQLSRLLLAKILAQRSNFLILDEPTNDLDIETLDFLLDYLSNYKGTAIVVSHDRDFLNQLVTRTLVLSKTGISEVLGGYTSPVKEQGNKQNQKGPNPVVEKKHSSYSTKHQLKLLQKEITNLEQEKSALEHSLSLLDLKKDVQKLKNLGEKLAQISDLLETKMQQWLKLEES